jgi:hypothetical protein
LLARRRWLTAILTFFAVQFHFLGDLVGSGGDWAIPYFFPLSDWELVSPIHWNLDAWPNLAITLAALLAIGIIGVRNGYTIVEVFLPRRADQAVVEALRRRFAGRSRK